MSRPTKPQVPAPRLGLTYAETANVFGILAQLGVASEDMAKHVEIIRRFVDDGFTPDQAAELSGMGSAMFDGPAGAALGHRIVQRAVSFVRGTD